MVIVMLIATVVNALLLVATGLLLGVRPRMSGVLAGSLLWGVLMTLCLLTEYSIFKSNFLRLVCALLIALLSFGFHFSSFRSVLTFLILHMSVTELSRTDKVIPLILCLLGITAVCMFGKNTKNLIPVELTYDGKKISLMALWDTGNNLRDPITGQQVLVVGADIAGKLTGLTQAELKDPVSAMSTLPGLRLIPYQTIGNSGFLLGLRIPNAKIGNQQGCAIVAFSPQLLGSNYQALTGGMV